MFTIEPDTVKGRILVSATGFWTAELAQQYRVELTAVLYDMRRSHASFDMLVDLQDAIALSQDAALEIQQAYEMQKKVGVRKFASICVSALQVLQVKRMAERDENYQVFATLEEAEAWLGE